MLSDLRFAFRQLAKAPGVTAIIILTLALGIGASTAIYSALDRIVLHPYDDPATDRNVTLRSVKPGLNVDVGLSLPDFLDVEKQATSFEFMAHHILRFFTLIGTGEALQLRGATVTPRYFDSFGITLALGRAFLPEEFNAGQDVVVLGHACWQRVFGGAPDIIGRTVLLNDKLRTVVGVISQRFERTGPVFDVWAPRTDYPTNRRERPNLATVTARLRRGVTVEQAQQEIDVIATGLAENYPDTNKGWGIRVAAGSLMPSERRMTQYIPILFSAAVSLILIACANIASLLLVRANARQREMSIRAALGAGRGKLIRQLLTESLLLALFGGAAGVLLAQWALDFIRSFAPSGGLFAANSGLGRIAHLELDGTVLTYALGLSVATALIFGLAPAWLSTSTDLNEALRQGTRGTTEGRSRGRFRATLVAVGIAMAFTLLACSGLLIRSFLKLTAYDLGFDSQHTAFVRLSPSGANFARPEQWLAFTKALLTRLQNTAGVEAAAIASTFPLAGPHGSAVGFEIEGAPTMTDAERPVTRRHYVSPDYFRTIGIPLKEGRFFSDHDETQGRSVAIVNRTLARAHFPDQNPIGKRIRIGQGTWREIVGVVGDVVVQDHGEEAQLQFYEPHAQSSGMLVIVGRSHGNSTLLPAAISAHIRALDSSLAAGESGTVEDVIRNKLTSRRLTLHLLIAFAAIGLLTAAIGIYGVIAFSVSQRTPEIGIRMALGAQQQNVLWMILRQGAWLVGIGLAIGSVTAFIAGRAIESLLYNTKGHDPVSLVAITVLFSGVAALACWLPARRAMKVDPIVALRGE